MSLGLDRGTSELKAWPLTADHRPVPCMPTRGWPFHGVDTKNFSLRHLAPQRMDAVAVFQLGPVDTAQALHDDEGVGFDEDRVAG